jgi:DNA-binding protein HU-beta
MSAITIKELTNEVSTSAGISKVAAEKVVTDLFGLITSSLHSGNDVVVKNFGRFYNHTRPARKGRNPMTGAAIDIQAKTIIKLAPRGDLK